MQDATDDTLGGGDDDSQHNFFFLHLRGSFHRFSISAVVWWF